MNFIRKQSKQKYVVFSDMEESDLSKIQLKEKSEVFENAFFKSMFKILDEREKIIVKMLYAGYRKFEICEKLNLCRDSLNKIIKDIRRKYYDEEQKQNHL